MGQKAKWEYFRAIYERYRQAARGAGRSRRSATKRPHACSAHRVDPLSTHWQNHPVDCAHSLGHD